MRNNKVLTQTGKAPQRGIVLLVVLSLLALFAVVMVTFVVVAGNFRSATASAARYRRSVDSERRVFEPRVRGRFANEVTFALTRSALSA